MTDPWAFQRWAYATKVGSAPRKAVLMMLAGMADANTGRCEAKQDTLAQGTEVAERTVRAALRDMERDGILARRQQRRRDGSRRGDEFLLLAPWVTEWPDGETVHPAGGAASPSGTSEPDHPAGDGQSTRQDVPGRNGQRGTTTRTQESERVRASAERLPDDFPEHLRPHARGVYRILRDVAEQHNAREVTPRAVGLAIMANPGHRFVGEAFALAAWAQAPPRPVRDVVGTYRTWLGKAERCAGVEQVTEQGYPSEAVPAGTVPLHGRRGGIQSGDFLAAAARMEAARKSAGASA